MAKVKTAAVVAALAAVASEPKRLGRPPVFSERDHTRIARYLKKFGLTGGIEQAELGTLHNGRGIKFSLTTAVKVARLKGIKFKMGRPKLKARKVA